MISKIVLISSGQPSLNPRLVKEADTLAGAGFDVTVLYAFWNDWGTNLDDKLLISKKWRSVRVGGDPYHKSFTYFASRLIFKLSYLFTQLTGSMFLADWAIVRSSYFLTREAKKHKADIYIGHNLGALPATIKAAKKNNKPCGFDAEDFHRNEVTNDINNIDVKIKTCIEDQYFPQLQYLSASSPLIGNEYQRLYPQIKNEIIFNTFPKHTTQKSFNTDVNAPIKLFWFSQTIGSNRGIEEIITALTLLKPAKFEFHLLGDVANHIRYTFTEKMSNTTSIIHFHKPIAPDEIIAFAAQFDIGLAAEKNIPFNRDICLTNKLFTYIQAGLPVLASNTAAQTAFIAQYTVAGKLYNNDAPATLADALLHYNNNREALVQDKHHNYQLGQTALNWDIDKERLLKIVNHTLSA